jgi:8-oxo-dGTP diphosphatase
MSSDLAPPAPPPAPPPQRPRVGLGVLVVRQDPSSGEKQILVGKRLGSHGAGDWALPGGHLEYLETLEGCARRETLEETGLVIPQDRFYTTAVENCIMPPKGGEGPPLHYVVVFMVRDISLLLFSIFSDATHLIKLI